MVSCNGRSERLPASTIEETMEDDPEKLRALAARVRRLADGVSDDITRQRLLAAAAEFEQRAKAVGKDDATG